MIDEIREIDSAFLPGTLSSEVRPGTLYLVGTPIGNLGDMSPRAAAILAGVDLVAAEDTRRTLRLLNHLGLRKRLESFHEHNWQIKNPLLLSALLQGRSVALVSDAGMPCISDPGYELVRLCADHDLTVTTIPGPCAAIVGLAGSGLISDRFVFEGFLPASGKTRKARLAELAAESRTSVLYEAPHRLRRTLADLAAAGMAERQLTLARELTKRHEEYLRLTVGSAISRYAEHDPRGEYVLVLEGREAADRRQPACAANDQTSDAAETSVLTLLRDCKARGLSVKDAVRQCAAASGCKKNDVYQMALTIWADM
jgi:16S rRNA (cytidine1402-2'-O)-methyltransferase